MRISFPPFSAPDGRDVFLGSVVAEEQITTKGCQRMLPFTLSQVPVRLSHKAFRSTNGIQSLAQRHNALKTTDSPQLLITPVKRSFSRPRSSSKRDSPSTLGYQRPCTSGGHVPSSPERQLAYSPRWENGLRGTRGRGTSLVRKLQAKPRVPTKVIPRLSSKTERDCQTDSRSCSPLMALELSYATLLISTFPKPQFHRV